jgi:hypothetical protein
VETETLALFEHLSFEFLEMFDVFAPAKTGASTRSYCWICPDLDIRDTIIMLWLEG